MDIKANILAYAIGKKYLQKNKNQIEYGKTFLRSNIIAL